MVKLCNAPNTPVWIVINKQVRVKTGEGIMIRYESLQRLRFVCMQITGFHFIYLFIISAVNQHLQNLDYISIHLNTGILSEFYI